MRCLTTVLIFCGVFLAGLASAVEPTGATLVPVTRIVSDEAGKSHFAAGVVALEMRDFSPPTAAIAVSGVLPANGLQFASLPADWFGDWHPAPRRQYVLVLQGAFEVESGDGEKRRIEAGSALLVEDISGPGHRTRVVSERAALLALIPVEPDAD